MHLVDFSLKFPLGSCEGLADIGGLGQLLVGVREILLGSAPVPVSALQKGPCLLQGAPRSAGFPLSNDQSILSN